MTTIVFAAFRLELVAPTSRVQAIARTLADPPPRCEPLPRAGADPPSARASAAVRPAA